MNFARYWRAHKRPQGARAFDALGAEMPYKLDRMGTKERCDITSSR